MCNLWHLCSTCTPAKTYKHKQCRSKLIDQLYALALELQFLWARLHDRGATVTMSMSQRHALDLIWPNGNA
eukprot:1161844-Pelagomonas_calceolata.AAC.5